MDKTTLGNRMKEYENVSKHFLLRRTPVVVRVDGKAFHTFTRKINSMNDISSAIGPSEKMHAVMMNTAQAMFSQMQNCVLAYTQSDEISFLLRDWDKHETEQWFNGNIQKIASVSAAMAATYFNAFWKEWFSEEVTNINDLALFDARVFNVPKEEVTNYFIWRQQDASRNSVQMIARKFFSHKQLHGKNNSEIQDMLMLQHNVNWNDYNTWKKRGACIVGRNQPDSFDFWDEDIPIFTQDRKYIEQYLEPVGD